MGRTRGKLATFNFGPDGPLLGVVDDAGGVVELEVDRIGVLRNRFVR
jgi:hypothetical protein